MASDRPAGEPRPTICLNMIVRDEAHVIRETLDSVSEYIDHWVVVDTGSTDSTISTIESYMADMGLPGEIYQRPWVDAGHNRTEALALCGGKADFIWVIDADDIVVGKPQLDSLRADSYFLRYGGPVSYWRRQIFRNGLPWRYQGTVHECAGCADAVTEERVLGDYRIESQRFAPRNLVADRYQRDRDLLLEAIERDPQDSRAAFYLAQNYRDAGHPKQALDWYTGRAAMGGLDEEVFVSLLRRAELLAGEEESWDAAPAAYLRAWQARPTRAEPLHDLARHYRLRGDFHLAYLFARGAAEIPYPDDDFLSIADDIYRWRAIDELAIAAYYVGRHEESLELCRALLDGNHLPETERARVQGNAAFSIRFLAEPDGEYSEQIVGQATSASEPIEDAEPPGAADAGSARARGERKECGLNVLESEVAIYVGLGWARWHPTDIETRGLAGTETAAYRVAESLSSLGYDVTLYGECEAGDVGGVTIRHWRSFDPADSRLALVSLGNPEVFDQATGAERRLLWMHGSDVEDRLTPERAERVDRILCLSSWHQDHLARLYPFAVNKLARVRNGITPAYFTGHPAPRRDRRVVYTSSPDRGLDVLLELWPLVREQVPDAELVHSYAPVYDAIADRDPAIGNYRDKVRRLADQPGVRSVSGLPQPKLAELMRSSLVWALPSYGSRHQGRFLETSCIGAMEAQAAGCWVVAGNWGALPETVRVGALIDGDPTSRRFRELFAQAIVTGLTNEQVQTRAQTEGPALALRWGWESVAEKLAGMIASTSVPA